MEYRIETHEMIAKSGELLEELFVKNADYISPLVYISGGEMP